MTRGFALTFVAAGWIGMSVESAGWTNVGSSSGGITEFLEDDDFHNRRIARVNDVASEVAAPPAAESLPRREAHLLHASGGPVPARSSS